MGSAEMTYQEELAQTQQVRCPCLHKTIFTAHA